MRNEISNSDDIIDSRDVIARIEELEAEEQALLDDVEKASEEDKHNAGMMVFAWRENNADELATLKAFADGAEGYSDDWNHGATLVRDSYFKEYAQELAEEIGAIDANASWPNTCIDWNQAARELQMDYTSVEFDGVTYWTR